MKFDKYKKRVLFQSCSKIEMEQVGTVWNTPKAFHEK